MSPRPDLELLSPRQCLVFAAIAMYYKATGEPCSVAYLARRLKLGRSTIREHLDAIQRKGWIPSAAAPRPRFPARNL
jgi:DNA-binding MarR family transcriptional regulator